MFDSLETHWNSFVQGVVIFPSVGVHSLKQHLLVHHYGETVPQRLPVLHGVIPRVVGQPLARQMPPPQPASPYNSIHLSSPESTHLKITIVSPIAVLSLATCTLIPPKSRANLSAQPELLSSEHLKCFRPQLRRELVHHRLLESQPYLERIALSSFIV